MSNTVVTLFTRTSCHLCETAETELLALKEKFHFTFEKIDIDKSDALTEQYGLMIPVVLIDGAEAGYGNINKFDISNRLQEKR